TPGPHAGRRARQLEDMLALPESFGPRHEANSVADRRRYLQEANPLDDESFVGKSISVDVSSDAYSFTANFWASGFDTKFLGGLRLVWKLFEYELSAHPPLSSTTWEKIIKIKI